MLRSRNRTCRRSKSRCGGAPQSYRRDVIRFVGGDLHFPMRRLSKGGSRRSRRSRLGGGGDMMTHVFPGAWYRFPDGLNRMRGGGSRVRRSRRGGGGIPMGRGMLGGGGRGGAGDEPTLPGLPGTTNLGGGGGAGGGSVNAYNCGSGGKGVVILSLLTKNYSSITTGSPTVTTSGTKTILKFTGSGSYTA